MELEEMIFESYAPVPGKLLDYGFQKDGKEYVYVRNIHDDDFMMKITVAGASVHADLTDTFSGEPYIVHRLNKGLGAYASAVKEEYLSVLTTIRDQCFVSTSLPDAYLVPSNPAIYDVGKGFDLNGGVLDWPQKRKILKGDMIFIYSAAPDSYIKYRCVAEDVYEKTYPGDDKVWRVVWLRRIKTYPKTLFPYNELKKRGLKTVRWVHKIPESLARDLLEKEKEWEER